MTIEVTVKREDEGNGNHLYVAVSDRDAHGNAQLSSQHGAGSIVELKAGESHTFCIHDMKDLRVYESEKGPWW